MADLQFPKYLIAAPRLRTTELGNNNAVLGSPVSHSKLNMSKKEGYAKYRLPVLLNFFSANCFSPSTVIWASLPKIVATFSNCG